MKVTHIKIKNIGIIADQKITIDKPLIIFYGETRQGKTTILNCVRYSALSALESRISWDVESDLCKTHRATKSRPYIMEIDGDDGETIRLDVFRDTPASRAYVRIHKEPKKDEEEEGVEENSEE